MSWVSDEMLAERRLRSSELALVTSRKRLVEADEEIGRLHARIVELEGDVQAVIDAAQIEPDRLQGELEHSHAQLRAAEQTLWDERERRRDLERELELTRAPWSAAAERELAQAQRRVRELEGELELVCRHASEFEQAIRVAVDDAWRWMATIGERLQIALREQHARDHPTPVGAPDAATAVAARAQTPAGPRAAVASSSPWVMPGSSTSTPTPPVAAPTPAGKPEVPVMPDRLDEARSRLRETPVADSPAAEEVAPEPPAPPEPSADAPVEDAPAADAPVAEPRAAEHPAAREPLLRRLFRRLRGSPRNRS